MPSARTSQPGGERLRPVRQAQLLVASPSPSALFASLFAPVPPVTLVAPPMLFVPPALTPPATAPPPALEPPPVLELPPVFEFPPRIHATAGLASSRSVPPLSSSGA